MPTQFHKNKEKFLDLHVNGKFKVKDLTGIKAIKEEKEIAEKYKLVEETNDTTDELTHNIFENKFFLNKSKMEDKRENSKR